MISFEEKYKDFTFDQLVDAFRDAKYGSDEYSYLYDILEESDVFINGD